MATSENNLGPSGRYSGESWKFTVEPRGDYERRRFQHSAGGQEKNRREHELVRRFLAKLPAASTVLDVPAGMGRFTELIRAAGHYPICIDLNFGRVAETRLRKSLPTPAIQGDITRLPLPDGSVSAAICFRLLHHLRPEMISKTLGELCRVAPRAFVTFYNRHTLKFLRKRLRGKPVSGQYYTPRQMIELSHAAGWTICRHETPFLFWQNLHALDLGK